MEAMVCRRLEGEPGTREDILDNLNHASGGCFLCEKREVMGIK